MLRKAKDPSAACNHELTLLHQVLVGVYGVLLVIGAVQVVRMVLAAKQGGKMRLLLDTALCGQHTCVCVVAVLRVISVLLTPVMAPEAVVGVAGLAYLSSTPCTAMSSAPGPRLRS